MQFESQIVEALRNDNQLNFKKETSGKLSGGTCPECGKAQVFISVEKPYQLMCNRRDNCGYVESTRARYSELWSNLADKFPASDTDPSATAKAYMSMVRGFPLIKTESWFEQGAMRLKNGNLAETVRFPLWDGYWWDRLINQRDIRDNTKNGEKPNKADFKYGIKYTDKCWSPPGQIIGEKDFVYIVEGIFHAIAFSLCGYKAIAAFSSNNLPREIIKANLGKNITWCLAYDAGAAGEYASLKYLKEINNLKEAARITIPHSANIDWDDLYRENELTEDYLTDCKWRGRMLSAQTVKQKAFALFCWKPFEHTILTFNKETYSLRIDYAKLTKELEGDKISFSQNEHADIFTNCVTVKHIANCEMNFLHIEKDKFTEERQYLFDVYMQAQKQPYLVALSPSNLGDAKAISTALLNQTDFGHFKGGARELEWLTKRWSSQKTYLVETVPFIGYVEDRQAYVFPNVGYSDGRYVKTNNHGYLHFDKFSIKTSLGGIEFIISPTFDGEWLPDFIKIFDLNGIAALAYWTLSLFAQQIKQKHQNLTFLEITGEKEAGKSTLIRFLWKLFGRVNYEGVDVLSMSASAEARTLSQVSNMPIVFLESDKDPLSSSTKGGRNGAGVDWERYKKISDLNGTIGSRGVKTNDNQTNDLIFRGSLVISQNATVQASTAILSRIVHLHCTTAHKKIENRPIADKLKSMNVEDMAGYLHHALVNEKAFLAAFFAAYPQHREALTKTTGIKSMRVIDNHAQVMAAIDALQVLFSNFHKPALQQALNHLIGRAKDRDLRLNAEHPLVQQFWETYHFINDQVMKIKDEDGEREVPQQRLNHSSDNNLIAINLNDYFEQSRMRGQELISLNDLKKVLPESVYYRYIETKKVRSRIDKKPVRCLVFAKPSNSVSD